MSGGPDFVDCWGELVILRREMKKRNEDSFDTDTVGICKEQAGLHFSFRREGHVMDCPLSDLRWFLNSEYKNCHVMQRDSPTFGFWQSLNHTYICVIH